MEITIDCNETPVLQGDWNSRINCRTLPMIIEGMEVLAEYVCENGLTDELVKVSANDTTAGYLNGKLIEGVGILLTENNDGANEDLEISVDESQLDHTLLLNIGTNTHAQIDTHIASTANPHGVTLEQARSAGSSMTGAFSDTVATSTTVALTLKTSDDSSSNRLLKMTSSSDVETFAVGGKGNLFITPQATTGTPSQSLSLTAPAHTTLTASVEYTDVNLNLARTAQFATGAIATQRAMRIQNPTYSFVGPSTITEAATLSIDGAPLAGTNATLTSSTALLIAVPTATSKAAIFRTTDNSTTINLLEVQKSDKTVINRIDGNGYIHNFVTNVHSNWGRGFVGFNMIRNVSTGSYDRNVSGNSGLGILGDYGNNILQIIAQHSTITPPSTTTQSICTFRASDTSISTRVEVAGYLYVGGTGGVNDQSYFEIGSASRRGIVVKGIASQAGNLIELRNSSSAVIGSFGPNSGLTIAQAAAAGTQISAITVTGAAHTSLPTTLEYSDVALNLNRTITFATGAIANQRSVAIFAPTIAFASASTVTNAATFYIDQAPQVGTNATLTNVYSVWVDAGLSRFDGGLDIQAANIQTDTTTGMKIATGTTQKLGFWNATPVVQNTGWGSITNVTPDKAYDANATTLDELADTLGTLVATLISYGILGA